jgi:putative inorganic carbon (hco3(-)) transporter
MLAARAQWPAGGVLLAICAAFGLLAGINPLWALAAALGAVFATLVAADLTVGLCVFIVVAFAERVPAAGASDLTLVKVLGALLAVSWLGNVATRRAGERQLFTAHPVMTAMAVLLLAWMLLSIGWAEDPVVARGEALRYALNLVLLPIVYSAVTRREHVGAVLGTYVAGAVLLALYGIATRETGDGFARISGLAGTANELASLLVTALLLAVGLMLGMRRAPVLRLMLLGAAVICLGALFLTLSRAGLVALGAALVAAIFVGGRRRLGASVIALILGAVVIGYFSFGASEQARERVTTIGGGTGRTDLWTVAGRMIADNPVGGVGVGNFRTSSIHYLLEPGALLRDEFIVDKPLVPHNVYLHVLAEMGVPGLVLFVGLLGTGVWCAWRAAGEFSRRGDPFLESCARALVLALVALFVADLFASDQLNKGLWVLLGLGPALLQIARRPEP